MKCSLCDLPSTIVQGHQHLCDLHYRFGQMRCNARRYGKDVPTREQLAQMIPDNLECPVCDRKMNWRARDGTATVVTLQHDRGGRMRMLCLSCNVRHASFIDDSFYSHDQLKRICPRCRVKKDFSQFSKDRLRRWKSANTYCRPCRTQMHYEWAQKNKTRENKKRRNYYHQRRKTGNPIPR